MAPPQDRRLPDDISTAIVTDKDMGVYVHRKQAPSEWIYAGTFQGEIGDQPAKFYCIDIDNPIAFYSPYRSDGPTSPEITYILNHYYPYVPYGARGDELRGATEVRGKKKEAAAIQLAIWYFSDGIKINEWADGFCFQSGVCRPFSQAIKQRARKIIQDAEANAGSTQPAETLEIQIIRREDTPQLTAQFKVIARDENGNGVPHVTVNLNATNGVLSDYTAITGDNGETPLITITLPMDSAPLTTTVTATANVVIPQGTRYVHVLSSGGSSPSVSPDCPPPHEKQKLVLATPTQATRQDTESVSWERDFGDAPNGSLGGIIYQYPTRLGDGNNGGARHFVNNGIYLGNGVDAEPDGQPSGDADGDDMNDVSDEDGVLFPPDGLKRGQENCIRVTASVDGYLNAWFDFNGDGDWDDESEYVFADYPLTAGTNDLCFTIPSSATTEKRVYARFRFTQDNPNGSLSYDGLWSNGEVEDYWVSVGSPTAVILSSFSAGAQAADPWRIAFPALASIALAGGIELRRYFLPNHKP
ncbi:MAG TPA: Cys-Gln thioester bond-forming surface protein [Caldilineae bacterium]|nr:Cys-Gln thioester bond-forming surface protein [Caldilineae bacterium]